MIKEQSGKQNTEFNRRQHFIVQYILILKIRMLCA